MVIQPDKGVVLNTADQAALVLQTSPARMGLRQEVERLQDIPLEETVAAVPAITVEALARNIEDVCRDKTHFLLIIPAQ